MAAQQIRCLSGVSLIACLAVVIGCGGGGGGVPGLGHSNVNAEMDRARSALITAEGGSLTVTGSNGVVYTLEVPEGALLRDTRITMYPVSSLENLSSAGPLAAGVHFTPEGHRFLFGSTLIMQLPAGVDPRQLVPIGYEGNAADAHFEPVRIEGQRVTMSLRHFSGRALGGRQLEELLQDVVFTLDELNYQHRMMKAYFEFVTNGTDPRAEFTAILKQWYGHIVEDALIRGGQPGFNGDDFPIISLTYDAWLDAILFAQVALLDAGFTIEPELASSETLAVAFLKRIYQSFNDRCMANPNGDLTSSDSNVNPLLAAGIALVATNLAAKWQIPAAPNQLDLETLLDNLCAKVVIESIDAFGLGAAQDLDVNVDARIRIAGGALRGSPAIKVSFLPSSGIASYSPASALTTAPDFQAFSNAALVGNPTQVTVKVKGCIQHSESLIRKICRFDQRIFTASATPPITIAPTFAAVEVGKSLQFTSNQSVTWSISNRQGGPTISSSGLFRSGIPGSFFVRATSTSDPTKFGETLVRVTPHAPFMASTYQGTYTENGITVQASAIFVQELGQPLLFVVRLPTGHQALFQVSDYSDTSFVHGAGDEVFGSGTATLPSQPIQAGATISLSFATTEGGIRFNGAGPWPNP